MKKSLLTVAVSVVLAAALSAGAPAALAASGEALDLSRTNSLTVHLPSAYQTDLANCVPDEAGAAPNDGAHALGVQVDLYLIADAVKIPGEDAYTYETFKLADAELKAVYGTGFTEEAAAKAGWQEMSFIAAKALLSGGTPALSPAASANVSSGSVTLEGLLPGLYLMVAHEPGAPVLDRGEGEEKTLGYYRESPPETEEDGAAGSVVTMAYSEHYAYSFAPALVSVPTRGQTELEEGEGFTGGNTAQSAGDSWMYELNAMLKGSHLPRYGSIAIVKTLSGMNGAEPAAFVFEITVDTPAGPGGEPAGEHYTRTAGVTFNAAGPQTVQVDRIPVGSTVTVREVYSGASYELIPVDEGEKTVSAAEIVGFSFTNEPTTDHRGGSGIVNSFELGETGWTWHKNGVDQMTE